jgi:hypothetical protein
MRLPAEEGRKAATLGVLLDIVVDWGYEKRQKFVCLDCCFEASIMAI